MSRPEAPNLGLLLSPFIQSVPDAARPRFLARLERGAADRYRAWAATAEHVAQGLLGCASREEEIAETVERIFPLLPADSEKLDAAVPGALELYYAIFRDLSLDDQLSLQANAERQGAAAWRLLASQQAKGAIRKELEACALLEEENALYLEGLVREGVVADA